MLQDTLYELFLISETGPPKQQNPQLFVFRALMMQYLMSLLQHSHSELDEAIYYTHCTGTIRCNQLPNQTSPSLPPSPLQPTTNYPPQPPYPPTKPLCTTTAFTGMSSSCKISGSPTPLSIKSFGVPIAPAASSTARAARQRRVRRPRRSTRTPVASPRWMRIWVTKA